MNHFIKLLNFELERFSKIFLALIGITFISQAGGMIYTCYTFLKDYNIRNASKAFDGSNPYALADFVNGTRNFFFWSPIAVGVTVIAIYIFFIWYRDWFATNTFIYRLLMLPVKRSYLFITKALTIFMYTLGLVAFQVINLHFLKLIFVSMIPEDARREVNVISIINSDVYLRILVPSKLDEFFVNYFFGFAVVIVIFTAILIERSFRFKGIFMAIAYCGAIIGLLIGSILYIDMARIFPSEFLQIIIAITALICICSFYLSNYLLNKKITV